MSSLASSLSSQLLLSIKINTGIQTPLNSGKIIGGGGGYAVLWKPTVENFHQRQRPLE